jgi:NitT/TauT family transport system permease protein
VEAEPGKQDSQRPRVPGKGGESRRRTLFGVRQKLSPQADFLFGLAGIAVVLTVWCVLTYGGHIKPLFLPTPTAMWESIVEFQQKDWLLPAIVRSTARVIKSLLLVIAIGVPIGILMGAFAPIDAFLRKLINGGKSVPTTGIIGLIVLWFSIEESAKTVFLFLGAIFYMIILVRSAVLSVNEDYLKVALDIGASRSQIIWRVLLPGSLPAIWDAIAVCSGIMWTYIVLAEFINNNQEQMGLGYLLYIGSRTQESAQVFSTLVLVAVISSLSDWIMQTVRRRYLSW